MEVINLLPHEEQRQLRAARTNVLLFRYNLLLLGAVAFLIIAVSTTYIYLTNTKDLAQLNITQNNDKSSSFIPIKNQADQFRTNLATAKQILDREVTYTKVVLAIAKVLPSGVVLENLNLDSQTFGTATTLVAHAKDYSRALALKESFQTSNLFSDVHFESIATGDSTSNADYPVTVNLNVTITKDAAK
jgi:Tfp pilus assembly protein PilN